jgi:uncharacterized phage-associated protein
VTAYHFVSEEKVYPSLTEEDIEILDSVIEKLGKMTKNEIVDFMHNEEAYKNTAIGDIISYKYAENLQIK